MGELHKIRSHFYRIPYSSLLAFTLAILGIILIGSTYRKIFLPLFQYFPQKRWHTALSLVEFLLVMTSFLHVAGLFMAFMATRSYTRPRFLGNTRKWTSAMSMGVVVLLGMILMLVTVAFFGSAAAIRVIEPGMTHACQTVPDSGDPSQVCLPLKPYGALDVMCGPDFQSFCLFWGNKLRLNSLIIGATFLLLSNLLLLSCAVANFMRFRHNIIDDVIKGDVYVAPTEEPDYQQPTRRNPQVVYSP